MPLLLAKTSKIRTCAFIQVANKTSWISQCLIGLEGRGLGLKGRGLEVFALAPRTGGSNADVTVLSYKPVLNYSNIAYRYPFDLVGKARTHVLGNDP